MDLVVEPCISPDSDALDTAVALAFPVLDVLLVSGAARMALRPHWTFGATEDAASWRGPLLRRLRVCFAKSSWVVRILSRVAVRILVGVVLFTLLGARAAAAPAPAPSLLTLLARHAPVLVLHPQEAFRPVPVVGFLADSDVLRPSVGGWEKVEGPLPRGGPELRLDQRLCSARDGIAATPCYASIQAARPSVPTVYGAAFQRGNRIALQYWLFYPFNPYSPTVPAGELWQVHEGDWEAVAVLLDARGRPLLAGYSQHSAGLRRDWARVPKRGSHPVAYVALGSHANYFAPGTHPLDRRIVEPLLIAIIEQNGARAVDHAGRGPTVRPRLARVAASSPSWMAFAGTWGEDQFLHAPGNEPVMFGAGPRGPAFHSQWRAPVAELQGWPRG